MYFWQKNSSEYSLKVQIKKINIENERFNH